MKVDVRLIQDGGVLGPRGEAERTSFFTLATMSATSRNPPHCYRADHPMELRLEEHPTVPFYCVLSVVLEDGEEWPEVERLRWLLIGTALSNLVVCGEWEGRGKPVLNVVEVDIGSPPKPEFGNKAWLR